MPSGFFILLRYFLRVDGVMLKLNDTRMYHDFTTDYILREYTSREGKFSDLKVSICCQIKHILSDKYNICLLYMSYSKT